MLKVSRILCFSILFELTISCYHRYFSGSKAKVMEEPAAFSYSRWYESLPTGPISNYEITASVFFHRAGEDLLPELKKTFALAGIEKRLWNTSVGSYRGSSDDGASMVWLRDFFPITIKSADSKTLEKARLVSYYSVSQMRNASQILAATREIQCCWMEKWSTLTHPQLHLKASRFRMPLILEAGKRSYSMSHCKYSFYL